LAAQLFKIDGVERVFYGWDFISVTKELATDWSFVKPEIVNVI